MMRFELGLEEPDPKRALRSAITVAVSHIVGGLVPLAPYILMADSKRAWVISGAITLLALAVFGFVKGHFTGVPKTRSAIQICSSSPSSLHSNSILFASAPDGPRREIKSGSKLPAVQTLRDPPCALPFAKRLDCARLAAALSRADGVGARRQ